ncbi:MAG: methyltransferase domain-containing protein [Anaerolineae bacterium]|nr:methyltransferase domain-containing protein [Anaerolineae bacterium]
MTTIQDKHAERGAPSYVWRAGQDRRLEMIRQWAKIQDTQILSVGCGLGAYPAHLVGENPNVYAFDIELDRAITAHERVPNTHVAAAEHLPYPDESFDVVFSNEVLEHVQDDQQALAEQARVLKSGGRTIIFCPNRWYPVETHGHYWRGEYHFGNTPLINYLPDNLRNRLAPHVRAYRRRDLFKLIDGLPLKVVHHTRIFGGYDNIIARWPKLGRAIRSVLYFAEKTPFRLFGLSHLLVLEKMPNDRS